MVDEIFGGEFEENYDDDYYEDDEDDDGDDGEQPTFYTPLGDNRTNLFIEWLADGIRNQMKKELIISELPSWKEQFSNDEVQK